MVLGTTFSAAVEPREVPVAQERVPLFRTVDLSIGESQSVELHDGSRVTVKLIDVKEQRDSLSKAVRRAEVSVEVDGQSVRLTSAAYNLPKTVGKARSTVPSPVVTTATVDQNRGVSIRMLVFVFGQPDRLGFEPDTFSYPVKQRWFATQTQMANEPTYVDGGDMPDRKTIYYHSGLDIGGTEGHVEVVAATDGLIVSAASGVLAEYGKETPVSPRYDVVYILDARGWYYRYSHLKEIDSRILPGRMISRGDRIGLLGKEGASGGWTHLHFEIKSRQPSGKWGTQAGYAFLWQSYLQQDAPSVIAVARPHHLLRTGESATLDATKSWGKSEKPLTYQWELSRWRIHLGSNGSERIQQCRILQRSSKSQRRFRECFL